jgi:hypothetical protein
LRGHDGSMVCSPAGPYAFGRKNTVGANLTAWSAFISPHQIPFW